MDGRTNWGARVKYKCKKDYSLSGGEDERVCLENGWSGQAPECVYTKCPGESRFVSQKLRHIGHTAVAPCLQTVTK